MISLALDEFSGKSGGLHGSKRDHKIEDSNKEDLEARELVVSHVIEVMPSILKTFLLLEDEGGEARKRIFNSSLVRRLLLCRDSVGTWITGMLRKKGIPSARAIDYLVLISEVSVEDYVGKFRTALPEDVMAFHEARDKVYGALDEIEGIVASLVVLDNAETERAATTPVVWHIMNKNLGRPFVVSLTTIDFVLHVTLLMVSDNFDLSPCDIRLANLRLSQAFRSDVSFYALSSIGDVPTEVVYFICTHYLIRKACEGLSLLGLSVSVFRGYFMNMWTIFDMIAIFLTVAAMR
jgi:hypothetical protein